MPDRLTRLVSEIADHTLDADMLAVVDEVARRRHPLRARIAPVRVEAARLLREAAADGARANNRRTAARLMLTRRELEVADLLELGMTNAEMARYLTVGERTIRAHLEAMSQKLLAKNRVELLARLMGG